MVGGVHGPLLCVDHVIWTGRRMLKLVLNIRLFLLLCFLCCCEMHFGAPSRSRKVWFDFIKKIAEQRILLQITLCESPDI